jgi:BirA family biotin operon repressor/biotin-[acetyl-CoA-carboxylase] ligase
VHHDHDEDQKINAVSLRILEFLAHKGDFASGEELSRKFSISRQAFWKHIEFLRHMGYDIEARPHCGYRVAGAPDKLFPFEIQRNMATKTIGKVIHYYPALESTMDKAFFYAHRGAEEGTVVVAEEQTKGRGRLGRKWISAKNSGIYLSVLLRPKVSPRALSRLTLLVGLAIVETLEGLFDGGFSMKWPNDILIKGKKIAGILTEIEAEQDMIKWAVVGIGLNVNNTRAQLPDTATSLRLVFDKTIERAALAGKMLETIEKYYYTIFLKGLFEKKLDAIKTHTAMLGTSIKIHQHQEVIEGTAYDIDTDGALIIRTPFGMTKKVFSGDVEMVR